MVLFSFFLATAIFILQGVGVPGLPLNAYAPWIALCVQQRPYHAPVIFPLIQAATAGIIADLISDYPLGVYPISYTLSAVILFSIRNRFSNDSPLHHAACTILISLLFSFWQIFLLFLFDIRISISAQWLIVEWFGTSLLDGFYALAWFSAPLYVWRKFQRYWKIFWLKKKHSHI